MLHFKGNLSLHSTHKGFRCSPRLSAKSPTFTITYILIILTRITAPRLGRP